MNEMYDFEIAEYVAQFFLKDSFGEKRFLTIVCSLALFRHGVTRKNSLIKKVDSNDIEPHT